MAEVETGTGGLGLSLREWEAAHGHPEGETGGLFRYQDATYLVVYYCDLVWNLTHHPHKGGSVPPEEARAAARRLMPGDAVGERFMAQRKDREVELYTSKYLRGRYDAGAWGEGRAGVFHVLYKVDAQRQVHTILLAAGDEI